MIKFGFASSGGFVERGILPVLDYADNVKVIGISDKLNHEAMNRVAKAFDIENTYPVYEDMLKNEDIDAVYIPAPNAFHKDMTIAAANAGKHVLCEKPMALNASQCREMVAACEANNVRLAIDFCYTYAGPQMKIKQLIDDGVIGDFSHIHLSFSLCGFTKDIAGWRGEPKLSGGGPLMDLAPHMINMAQFYAQSKVESVTAYVKPEMTDTDTENDASGALEFESGKTATFETSFIRCTPHYFVVAGTKGTIRAHETMGWKVGGNIELTTLGDDWSTEKVEFENIEGLANHFKVFADNIENNKPHFADGHAGLHAQQVIDAIVESGKSGKRCMIKDF